jgi:outer membrane protein OmpA-like peptidoglycan-associated protein
MVINKKIIKMKKNTIFIFVLFNFLFLLAQNEDAPGSKDYDLLGRMPNYNIRKYWDYEFDAHMFYTSDEQKQSVEGRKIVIRYEHQDANNRNVKKPSYLQILRNYSSAISKAGGEILHEHKNADFGSYFFKTPKGKEVWVEIETAPNLGRRYSLTVIEREPMKQDIVIKADLIKEKIELEGKIAIYGIYFDVGLSQIKPDSEESLEQIALFLKDNPEINCWVVGHTDSDGSFETNSTLSLARAQAVAAYLQNNYSISPDRLFAEGVGPLAPISSNDTEEGKKLNRRVELVKK